MRAIAAEAGVGIATLDRHFPTREAIAAAVYQDQVTRLVVGARELVVELPPAAALRRWMDRFGDWIASKNGMLETLLAMIKTGEIGRPQTPERLPMTACPLIITARSGRAYSSTHGQLPASPAAGLTRAWSPEHIPQTTRRPAPRVNHRSATFDGSAQSPTLPCMMPPSTTTVVAVM
ncbi:MAG TPA: TetR/AcrR family transcriptional regulator [Solirubrobacteraceae bacterium]|nr:TetR/AcrR family transcriptional regulator [Solirubrobacteraceae bacterium]